MITYAANACLGLEEYYERTLGFAAEYANSGLGMDVEVWQYIGLIPRERSFNLKPVRFARGEYRDDGCCCHSTSTMIAVSSSGEIMPCNQMSGYLMEHGMSFGNVRKTPLRDLLSGGAYVDVASMTAGDLRDGGGKCGTCPYFEFCGGGCRALGVLLTGERDSFLHEGPLKVHLLRERLVPKGCANPARLDQSERGPHHLRMGSPPGRYRRPARPPSKGRIMLCMATEPANILTHVTDRVAFRAWLERHHATERECWVATRRGRPTDDEAFWYIDAVEEALCFGWVDSVYKVVDGTTLQRFSPRKPRSPWTELNKERVRRLEKLGLMTDAGRAVLPPMGPRSFKVDPDVMAALKAARCWSKFRVLPPLYQRVRAYNVAFYKARDPEAYERALANLIAHTKRGETFGEWSDYGRLIDY